MYLPDVLPGLDDAYSTIFKCPFFSRNAISYITTRNPLAVFTTEISIVGLIQ